MEPVKSQRSRALLKVSDPVAEQWDLARGTNGSDGVYAEQNTGATLIWIRYGRIEIQIMERKYYM
jgi:hypothetical protein